LQISHFFPNYKNSSSVVFKTKERRKKN